MLKLADNQLTTLPFGFNKLKELQYLSMYKNEFDVLPKEVCSLEKLEFLDIYGNNLVALPAEIGRLTNLREFKLSSNKFVKLPNEIGALESLESLSLQYNDLIELPETMGRLGNLSNLIIRNNPLTTFPGSLGRLKKLKRFDFEWINLGEIPQDVNTFTNEIILAKLFRMRSFDIKHPSGEEDWKGILNDLIRILEPIIAICEANEDVYCLVGSFKSLGEYYCLLGEFENGEKAIRKAMNYRPELIQFNRTLAPALLFQGKLEAAKQIYLSYKDKVFDPNGKSPTFKEAFLVDFKAFEKIEILSTTQLEDLQTIKDLLTKE